MRAVIRQGMNTQMADLFLQDLISAVGEYENLG